MRPERTRGTPSALYPTGRSGRSCAEDERGRDGAAAGELDAVRLARRLRSRPPHDQRRRTAAVEVERVDARRAPRSVSASSPSVSPASWSARPSQATASSRPRRVSAERGARIAAVGDVGVELVRRRPRSPRRRRDHRPPARDEQRPGLQQVAARARPASSSRRAMRTRPPATCTQARSAPRARRRARTARARRACAARPAACRRAGRRSRRPAPRARRGRGTRPPAARPRQAHDADLGRRAGRSAATYSVVRAPSARRRCSLRRWRTGGATRSGRRARNAIGAGDMAAKRRAPRVKEWLRGLYRRTPPGM